MRLKRFWFLPLVIAAMLAFGGFAAAQDADPAPQAAGPAAPAANQDDISGSFDMERCVKRALELNPSMTAIRAQLQGSKFGTKSAFGAFLPSASANYGWTHYDRTYSYSNHYSDWASGVSLSQPVFHGFSILANWQQAQLTEESTAASLDNVELTLIGNVQSNFLSLLKARMDVKSAEDSVARLESQLKVITAFYDVGLRPKAEVLDAEVDLATARQGLLNAQNNVSIQETQLNTLLNIPVQTQVDYVGELKDIPFDLGLKDCLTRAYKGRPDLVIGEKSVEIAKKNVVGAESNFYPQVDAEWNYTNKGVDAGLGKGGSDGYSYKNKEYWTAGVSASMNIFRGGQDYYNLKQYQEVVKQVQAELENTRLNAGFEVKQALLNIKSAADSIDVARKSVEAATEAYRMAVARYQAQVGTNTDVLNAQSRLTETEAQLSQSLANYGTAISTLYVAMGEKNLGLKEAK